MNVNSLREQLQQTILPFWVAQMDPIGGFIGEVSEQLLPNPTANKGGVMTSRYIWAFSASYRLLKNDSLLHMATHGFRFLIDSFWDQENGGIYWSVDYTGAAEKTLKHVYAQSFAIYALSEYHQATQNQEALDYAIQLFKLIETHAFSAELAGYHEEFTRSWSPQSSTEVTADIEDIRFTTNTHLHLLEAYTNLYSVWPDKQLATKITFLQDLFCHKIFHSDGYFHLYFDKHWQSLTPGLSYGHDIESAWLLDRSVEVLGKPNVSVAATTKLVSAYQLRHGLDLNMGMFNETNFDTVDKTKVWWIQAEALIGFYNAYQKTQQPVYLQAVENLWIYVQNTFIDSRQGSEWIAYIKSEESLKRNISDFWKGPYHTVRMYLELIKRMETSK